MARRRKPTGSPGYIPPKERREAVKNAADRKLDRFIRNNPEGDRRNTEESPIQDVVRDMPKKFQSKFKGIENYGDMNQAQKALFGFYDNRNKYQRDMDTIRTSSPQMMDAYARRFPISNFAMKAGPMIAGAATGIPFGVMDLFNKGRNKFTNLSDRDDILGAIARTTNDIASSFTPEQAKNIDTNIETKKPIDKVLRDENIITNTADFVSPADMNFNSSQNIVDIFDNDGEKAAMDASLPTGDIVYNPYVEAPYQSKLDFINEVYGTNFSADRSGILLGENQANELFEKAKQEQGNEITESIAGQFNLEPNQSDVNLSGVTDYEKEFEDTFGVPMKGNIEAMRMSDKGTSYGLGDRLTRERFALDNNIPLDQLGEIYPKVSRYPIGNSGFTAYDSSDLGAVDQLFDGDTGIGNTVFSDKISNTPKLGQEIRGFNISNPSLMPGGDANIFLAYPGGIGLNEIDKFKDGGGVNTDNYGNMSTHEKLMRMASKMYG